MPDQQAPQSIIFNSLATGEVSPALYGRTDLAKFHSGAFTMRNFFVDYKGGAKSRPGTQFMGIPPLSGFARLWPFKFSAAIGQTYILVFVNLGLYFIKNPGGLSYPNSSNSGFIQLSGSPYGLITQYVEADLRTLKFSQLEDTLTITHPNYPRQLLTRITDTNWTLTVVTDNIAIQPPAISNITTAGLPSG